MLNRDDILSYYVDENNNLYQMIGYCPSPTIIMLNITTKQTEHIVPDCLNAEKFIKLVKETDKND